MGRPSKAATVQSSHTRQGQTVRQHSWSGNNNKSISEGEAEEVMEHMGGG